MMGRLLPVVGVVVVTSLGAGPVATGPTDRVPRYEIDVERDADVGQRIRLRGEATQERVVSTVVGDEGDSVCRRSISVTVDLQREVRALGPNNEITRASYVVTECVMTIAGTSSEIAPAGAVIVADHDGPTTVFAIEGRELAGDAAEALGLMIGADVTGEMFGAASTSQPRAVGERWPVDVVRVVDSLRRLAGQPVLKHDVTGDASLVDVKSLNGRECVVINTHLTVRNVMPGLEEFPTRLRLRDASFTSMAQGIFPLDPTQPPAGEALAMNLFAVLAGPVDDEGTAGEIRVSMRRTVRREATLISSALTVVND